MLRLGVAAALVLVFCHFSPSGSTACQLLPSFPPAVFCVDANGCCNFTTVQAAVDAVPPNSQNRSIVWINSGIYFEKVIVKKPNVTFQGQGLKATTIVWNDTANSTHRTPKSASVQIDAPGFVAKNISFKNAAPAPKPGAVGAQAVAIRISGDMAAFWGCGFFGAQDTLLDDQFRHYFKECFIEGSIDFIFGDGRSLYENCKLNSIAEELPQGQHSINGAITAQGRKFPDNDTGFSFVGCTIQGSGNILLGRAWEAYSRVVFAYTYMPAIVASEGWDNWGQENRNSTVFFGEYGCRGDGANMAGRVPYARKLDDSQARPFLDQSYVDGHEWLKPFDDLLIAPVATP
ncbi:hypothetical protein PVAP13_1NG430500 [Panicum virgatum]|uniref:Pectinesterase n=1 Tax=Panicum virgatum TaxID=38727 RepID=A0A8T0X5K3_PANVG|nr:hypothetical protein PVAP13_1NG430500 [Panicum virgatum]